MKISHLMSYKIRKRDIWIAFSFIFGLVIIMLKVSMAINENRHVFPDSDVAKVSMPIIQSIDETHKILFIRNLAGRFGERVAFELISAAIKSVSDISIVDLMSIWIAIMMIIPFFFVYLIAIKITADQKIGLISALIFSIIVHPFLTNNTIYSLIFLPFYLYLSIQYTESLDNTRFLLLILASFVGFSLHPPLHSLFLTLLAFFGIFKAFYGSSKNHKRLKFLNLMMILPITVLLYYPFFYSITYPEILIYKPDEYFINEPFDLFINACYAGWLTFTKPELAVHIFKFFIASLMILYFTGIYALRGHKFSEIKIRQKIGSIKLDELILISIILLPLCVALVKSNFDFTTTIRDFGEFNRQIFHAFTVFLLIGFFSALYNKDHRFLFFIYVPMVILLFRPLISHPALGPINYLTNYTMDRGYFFNMTGVAISGAIMIRYLFKELEENAMKFKTAMKVKRFLAFLLIIIICTLAIISIRAVNNYYQTVERGPDQDYENVIQWLRNRSSMDRIYCDDPYYRALIWPSITVFEESEIRNSYTNLREFYEKLRQYNITYIIVRNPAYYPSGFLDQLQLYVVYKTESTVILWINQTFIEERLSLMPFGYVNVDALWNEDFDDLINLQAVNFWRAVNISISLDPADKKEGDSSVLLTWSSTPEGAGTAAIKKEITPSNFTNVHMGFWIKITSPNVGMFGIELRDKMGERVQMWNWKTSHLKLNTWYLIDLSVGYQGTATQWERGIGNLSEVSTILFKGVTERGSQEASLKFDLFSKRSQTFRLTVKIQDKEGSPLTNATVLAFWDSQSSSVELDNGLAIFYLPINTSYILHVLYEGKQYPEISRGTLTKNIEITIRLPGEFS